MMKKQQIINLFKQNIESHIPTAMPRIDWSLVLVEQSDSTLLNLRKPHSNLFPGFKMILSVMFVFAMIIFGIGLLNTNPVEESKNPYTNIVYQKTLSISAVSTATLISNYTATSVSTNQALSLAYELAATQTVDTIEPYLEMIETITGQNLGIAITNEISENPLYESKVVLTTLDLLGNVMTYTLYFNSISYQEKDNQVEFTIEGIFLFKNRQYEFLGKKEIDGDEEIIAFKTISDASNYVESSYKIEDGESKYNIKIVENGVIVSQSKIRIEDEDGQKKINFEYIDGQNNSQYEFEYDTEGGKNILKVEYQTITNGFEESGQMQVEIKIDSITGQTSYQIFVRPDGENEYEYESDRKIDHDDDDDEQEPDEENERDEEDEEDESED